MKLYGEISKTEEQADGTLLVFGIASTAVVDTQGETVTPEAMKAAIPDYMTFGAVREMHDPKKAAGTAVSIDVGDDGNTNFQALVVDPTAILKVKTGVYKGFSIGGNVTLRNKINKAIIEGLRLMEISLVDRPANPGAVFSCYKAEASGDEEEITKEESPVTEELPVIEEPPVEPAAEPVAEDSEKEAAAIADEPPAADPEEVTVVAKRSDGTEMVLKRNSDGSYTEVISKGSYSISNLAELAERLEWFACCETMDAQMEGDSSPIPAQAIKLAGQLYDMLLALVAEDVAEAKDRLKGIKNLSAECSDLNKIDASLGEFIKVFGDSPDQSLSDVIDKVVSENLSLAKRVRDLEARPANGRVALKVVAKGDDLGGDGVGDSLQQEAAPTDPVSALKKIHRDGGVRVVV